MAVGCPTESRVPDTGRVNGQPSASIRAPGFYWVRTPGDGLEVAEWLGDCWWQCGMAIELDDSQVTVVSERLTSYTAIGTKSVVVL